MNVAVANVESTRLPTAMPTYTDDVMLMVALPVDVQDVAVRGLIARELIALPDETKPDGRGSRSTCLSVSLNRPCCCGAGTRACLQA